MDCNLSIRRGLLPLLLLWTLTARSQQVLPLYEGAIPGALPAANEEEIRPNQTVDTIALRVSLPTLTVFLPPPEKANGAAVIICPGGGYHALLVRREGSQVAEAFNRAGVTAFVLKYRLPDDRIAADKSVVPLQDAQKAIQIVRRRAVEWGIDPNRVGIMGFSAGGHLAATAGTNFGRAFIGNPRNISLRPDFMLLINPVISFTDSIGHIGSRDNLLGPSPAEAQIRFYSNELRVTARTPPAFLVHASPDSVVSSKNSLYFYQALLRHGVSAELHLYGEGEHGFLTAPPFGEWFGRCLYWLRTEGWLEQDRAG